MICLNNTIKTSSTLCNKLPAFNNNLILQVLNLLDKRSTRKWQIGERVC